MTTLFVSTFNKSFEIFVIILNIADSKLGFNYYSSYYNGELI